MGVVDPCTLLTLSLNNKTNIAPLTLDQVSVGQWCNLPTMRLNTPCFQTSTPMMHLLFKHENDNCVRQKLAKNTWHVIGPEHLLD